MGVFCVQMDLFDERHPVEVKDPENQALRYLLCKKPRTAADERQTWSLILERLKAIRTQTCRLGAVTIPQVISTPDAEQQHILDLLKAGF